MISQTFFLDKFQTYIVYDNIHSNHLLDGWGMMILEQALLDAEFVYFGSITL